MLLLLALMKIVGYSLALLTALLTLAILLPVKMTASGEAGFQGTWEDILDGQGRKHASGRFLVSVLAGAVTVSHQGTQTAVKVLGVRVWSGRQKPKDEDEPKRPDDSGQSSPQSSPRSRSGLGNRKRNGVFRERLGRLRPYLASDVRGRTMDFLRRCISASHVQVDADIVYGLEDPGVTGMVYAAYVVSAEFLGITGLRLGPSFVEEVLDAKGSVSMWALPAVLIWHGGMFFMSPKIRPLWRKKPDTEEPLERR